MPMLVGTSRDHLKLVFSVMMVLDL
jgi:hypothetical protein